jgi:UDP-3-O-[3-hydroxymyristoyl] glucosamine N-acyltransferase
MVDPRFHPAADPAPLPHWLQRLRPALNSDDARASTLGIAGADELDSAGVSHIALAAHASYSELLRSTAASAVIVSPALRELVPSATIAIIAERPHHVFADLLGLLYPSYGAAYFAEPLGDEGRKFWAEQGVALGANVVLGAGVEIGAGSSIGANTVIGPGVAIGQNTRIASNCSIDFAYIGDDVVIHPGVRIGTEGFGWLDFGKTNRKIPQLGRVIIQDDVEIGANSTVDRGALGDTVIGEGTKIDNLVQIGHNCRIGRYCLIAATSGLSGGTILEDGVLLGGGVGTAGHLTIGAGSIVHGRAGVSKSWPAGSKLFGAPAQDITDAWRELATLRRLARKGKKHD